MNPNTQSQSLWKSKQHVVWRVKGGLLVVLDTVSGHYYTLNETAVDLWRGVIEQEQSLEAVFETLQARYLDTPDASQLETDCRESIAYWVAEGLIEPAA